MEKTTALAENGLVIQSKFRVFNNVFFPEIVAIFPNSVRPFGDHSAIYRSTLVTMKETLKEMRVQTCTYPKETSLNYTLKSSKTRYLMNE